MTPGRRHSVRASWAEAAAARSRGTRSVYRSSPGPVRAVPGARPPDHDDVHHRRHRSAPRAPGHRPSAALRTSGLWRRPRGVRPARHPALLRPGLRRRRPSSPATQQDPALSSAHARVPPRRPGRPARRHTDRSYPPVVWRGASSRLVSVVLPGSRGGPYPMEVPSVISTSSSHGTR